MGGTRLNLFTESTAQFSPCMTYRYKLTRVWDKSKPVIGWIMLNPSTADEEKDDNTVRRVGIFSRDWGFGGFTVRNIFSLRSTDPALLYTHADPIGPENDEVLEKLYGECDRIMIAWGTHGKFSDRAKQVASLLWDNELWCLGTNADGSPKHPLYLKGNTKPKIWRHP